MINGRLKISMALCAFYGSFCLGIGIDPSNTQLGFLAKGFPSALKINGKFKGSEGLVGNLTKSDSSWSLNANCSLKHFETGLGLRDQHMREKYLEVAEHPSAILSVKESPLGRESFVGELSLHGVTKSVSGTVKWDGDIANIEFPLRLSDFNIGVPSFMGITVAQEVFVSAQVEGLQ